MSAQRMIFFSIGKLIDRSGLVAVFRRIFTSSYTLYKAKDLGGFGRGSSIEPFCVIHAPGNVYLGSGTHVRSGCLLQADRNYGAMARSEGDAAGPEPVLRIGDGTLVGRFCHITAQGRIDIGERVLMGERILIADHDHGFEDTTIAPRDQPPAPARPITIGDACWIGDAAAILGGTKLGNHVVVGANAVVRGEVPPYTVVAGNPARPVKRYDKDRGEWVKLDRDAGT